MRSSASASIAILCATIPLASAYSWVGRRGLIRDDALRAAGPVPLEPRAAEPYSPEFPYTGALPNGLPGLGLGGKQVPAPGDTAHQFQPPPPGAHRGPCPAMNTLANHGYISRDGITTFDELVAAQQNVWNLFYDNAVFLATLGVAMDGDIVTQKVSIGGDATEQTSYNPALTGRQLGLNNHNPFESDTSLSRNDYYTANGDNWSFNGTLFKMMADTCNGIYDFKCLVKYRAIRYNQSLHGNGQFFFTPLNGFLVGAAAFLVNKAFASQASGLIPIPDEKTVSSFFGALKNAAGGYDRVPERIPDGFVNRVVPITFPEGLPIVAAYIAATPPPGFGANVNGTFIPSTNVFAAITDGPGLACVFYNFLMEFSPGVLQLPKERLVYLSGKLNPMFANLGCPVVNNTQS